jgi:penicillin amidase
MVGNRKLYKHNEGVNTNFILDGASGNDITDFWISQNPSAENPEWGYVYSANNQARTGRWAICIQAIICQKIEQKRTNLLDSNSNWDKESVSKMMVDNTAYFSVCY